MRWYSAQTKHSLCAGSHVPAGSPRTHSLVILIHSHLPPFCPLLHQITEFCNVRTQTAFSLKEKWRTLCKHNSKFTSWTTRFVMNKNKTISCKTKFKFGFYQTIIKWEKLQRFFWETHSGACVHIYGQLVQELVTYSQLRVCLFHQ